ncbi:hypothetical protein CC2G_013462 [Coprinopsis cinerea AmutBmut pab1-1]|nr:hypothetical protein CC2G_013462 [Coprinopsis cinerea AmutBmut pab1-1]
MLDLRFWNLALLFVFVLRWGVSPGFASPLDSGASVESRGRDLSRGKELRREKELRQTTEEPKPCFFSCPPTDARGLPLVRRAGAVGPASWYDVIECLYAPKHWHDSGHTCVFDKRNGTPRMGYVGDGCPPRGVPCSTSDSFSTSPSSMYSSHDRDGGELGVDRPSKLDAARTFYERTRDK